MMGKTIIPQHLPERNAKTFVGDGVYVSFDGWQIILRAPRENGDHYVALDPMVYAAMMGWIKRYPGLAAHMNQNL